MKKVDIIVIENTHLEAIAFRSILESFNVEVRMHFIGNVKQLISILSNPNKMYKIVILCCHGQDGKLIIPQLAPQIEKDMPYKAFLTAQDCNNFIKLDKHIVINTGCDLGHEAFAMGFLTKGCAAYLGVSDDVEASASIYFVISFLYFYLCKNDNVESAYDKAACKDKETKLFKLWLS